MTNRDNIIKANKDGLANKDSLKSYYTPILQSAFELGQMGIDLSDSADFTGYRYGLSPEHGLSYNYMDAKKEHGLSLAQKKDGTIIASAIWFCNRDKMEYTGLLLPMAGSDGEALILPYNFELLD